MRSNPDQTLAAYRESMRHPRPSARIRRHHQEERPFEHAPTYPHVHGYNGAGWPEDDAGRLVIPDGTDNAGRHVSTSPDGDTVRTMPDFTSAIVANGSFVVEMRAFLAASSPAEIAAAVRDLFTDTDQREICRLIMDGES